jgi:GNAT superfamily N-acetyltransferase
MVLVREVVAGDWEAFRDIRLEALRDTPEAFGSTHQREVAFVEADWQRRIARPGNFLGYLPEASATEPVGLVGALEEDPGIFELVSMYVRPPARGRGVGEALIATVVDWAAARNAKSVHLWVTETNKPARLLYERSGFVLTGERQPLPSNPTLGEVAMSRTL